MAQAWGSLGSRVTVIEAQDRLLAREEPFAGDELRTALGRQGVDVRLGVSAKAVSRHGDEITMTLEDGERLTGDRLLVAIGRRPLTDDLGLETVGLPGGVIDVDDHLRVTDHPWLYAIGDVNGRSLLTHSGKYQARIAADQILGEDTAVSSDSPGAPRVIFTDPQIAAVGLTLEAARQEGIAAEAIDRRRRAAPGRASMAAASPARRASSSTATASCSSARRSSERRSQSCCTPSSRPTRRVAGTRSTAGGPGYV